MKTFDHTSGKEIQVDDAVIYYEEIENPGKPVLLFLHGGFGNIEDFNTIIAGFCKDYHIIGIDSRGHGRSTLGTGKLSYERLQTDVEFILKSLQIDNITIIGISDGAIVGYRIAAAAHFTVDRLITIGGTWSTSDMFETQDLLSSVTADSWKEKFPEIYDQYEKLNPQKDFKRFTDAIKAMWLDNKSSGYPNEKVKLIKCPTLIIRGDEDHLFSRKSAAELADHIAGSKLLNMPYASHMPFSEQPVILQIIIQQFLTT